MATGRAKPAGEKGKKPPDKKQILLSQLPPTEKLLVLYLRTYGTKDERGWSRTLSRKRLAQLLSTSLSGASETVRDAVQRGMVEVAGHVDEHGAPKANTLTLRRRAMEQLVREPKQLCYSGACLRALQRRQAAYERGIARAAKELRKKEKKGPKPKKHGLRPWRLRGQLGSPEAKALWELGKPAGFEPASVDESKSKEEQEQGPTEQEEKQLEEVAEAYWLAKGDLAFEPEKVSPKACLKWKLDPKKETKAQPPTAPVTRPPSASIGAARGRAGRRS